MAHYASLWVRCEILSSNYLYKFEDYDKEKILGDR